VSKPTSHSDFLIIGGGVVGLAIAVAIQESKINQKITIVEKENQVCIHASGRNSGVIHAGFYYSSESLKSKFSRLGNTELKKFCRDQNLPVLKIGKVVVAKNDDDVRVLEDLATRAQENSVELELLTASKLTHYEPLARTHEKFLWSPNTAIADPKSIAKALEKKFLSQGGYIVFGEKLASLKNNNATFASGNAISFDKCINSAGSGALDIAHSCGVAYELGLLPVLGGYVSTPIKKVPLRTLVYSTPHPLSPFLGIHFTHTLDNRVKIGPTALPVIGREQYSFNDGFSVHEARSTLRALGTYAIKDPGHAVSSILQQFSQASVRQMVSAASELVPDLPPAKEWARGKAGIRSQLIDLKSGEFIQDFLISESSGVIHILNAVSPGWTSALPFGRYIVEEYLGKNL
jgi:L-2-hydroxyglutarate oxidase